MCQLVMGIFLFYLFYVKLIADVVISDQLGKKFTILTIVNYINIMQIFKIMIYLLLNPEDIVTWSE